jgi:hypothetical protein
MAYTHSKSVVWMTNSGGVMEITATDLDLAQWDCPYPPHIIRRVGIMPLVSAELASAAVFSIMTATTPTLNTLTTIGTLNGGGSHDAGKILLSTELNTELSPGHSLNVNMTTTGGLTIVKCFAYVEPRWESATNLTTNVHVTT